MDTFKTVDQADIDYERKIRQEFGLLKKGLTKQMKRKTILLDRQTDREIIAQIYSVMQLL